MLFALSPQSHCFPLALHYSSLVIDRSFPALFCSGPLLFFSWPPLFFRSLYCSLVLRCSSVALYCSSVVLYSSAVLEPPRRAGGRFRLISRIALSQVKFMRRGIGKEGRERNRSEPVPIWLTGQKVHGCLEYTK